MGIGFSAIALPVLLNKSNPGYLDQNEASWFASISSIATPVGCLISGPIADRYGRKTALLWINVVSFIGWAVITVAYYQTENQYLILLVGRMITGCSIGLASMPAVVYMTEVSSPSLRATFTTWNASAFALGVFIIYSLGWFFKENWGASAAIVSLFPCIGIILTYTCLPESPSWLIVNDRTEEATEIMCKLHRAKECNKGVSNDIKALVENVFSSTNVKSGHSHFFQKLQNFCTPNCFKPLIIMLMYFFFQQCSGVYVIVFYAVDIVDHFKLTLDPYFAISLIAATRIIAAILVGIVSKRYGRRPLSLTSGSIMTICMITLAGYLYLQSNNLIIPQFLKNWLPLTLLMVYYFSSTLGFLTVPFAMAAEVFPTKIRAVATGLVTCMAYIFNFVIIKGYPTMIQTMGASNLFFFYGGVTLIGTVFLLVFLPETKGKTLKEIEEYFGKSNNRRDKLNEIMLNC